MFDQLIFWSKYAVLAMRVEKTLLWYNITKFLVMKQKRIKAWIQYMYIGRRVASYVTQKYFGGERRKYFWIPTRYAKRRNLSFCTLYYTHRRWSKWKEVWATFFPFYTAYKGVNFYVKLQQQFEINTFFSQTNYIMKYVTIEIMTRGGP